MKAKSPTGIKVGGSGKASETVKQVTKGIVAVMDASFTTHQDREVVLAAIQALGNAGRVDVSISDCDFEFHTQAVAE